MQKRANNRGRAWIGNLLLPLVTLTVGSLVWWSLNREPGYVTLKYGELIQILSAARRDPAIAVRKVQVSHSEIGGEIVFTDHVSDGSSTSAARPQTVAFRVQRAGLENDQGLHALLRETAGPAYEGAEPDTALKSFLAMVSPLLMLLCIGAVLFFVFRWSSGGGSPLTFGRSRAKLYAQKDLEVTFEDVAGIDEAVAELREVVDFLKTPDKYQALGGRIPKGVLLVGPPGTGKTLLAKAVAGEADVAVLQHVAAPISSRCSSASAPAGCRDLFAQAESRAPCIIFIDELDALGKTRGGGGIGGHDEREQTLNQLLVEMDGFDSNRGVIIMAATNRPETLDPALLRPGRFDRTVVVDRPDIAGPGGDPEGPRPPRQAGRRRRPAPRRRV